MEKRLVIISPPGERLTIAAKDLTFGSVKAAGDDYTHLILKPAPQTEGMEPDLAVSIMGGDDDPDVGMSMSAGCPSGITAAQINAAARVKTPLTLKTAKGYLAALADGEEKVIVLGSTDHG